jgi:hypothetical protein
MRPQSRTNEQKIARLATTAHGIVTWAELRAAEISPEAIKRRVVKGLLIPEYRGVYRVGHRAPSVDASYMAAVKACGPDAALSDLAAGHFWRLLKGPPPPPQVTAPTERKVDGLKPKRSRLHHGDVTTFQGIRITTVARTLVDLAPVLEIEILARACHEAAVLYRTTPQQVEAVLARRPKARGAKKLRAIIRGQHKVTLSKLERRFLELLIEHGLPLPDTNTRVGKHRVDCHWQALGLTVELDSYTYHNSYHAWHQGHDREREARKRGEEFRSFTYDDVFEDPTYMLDQLRELLS